MRTTLYKLLAVSFLAAPAFTYQVDELVAHWTFNEPSGTVFQDLTGNPQNADIQSGVTLGLPGWVAESGNSARFNANQNGMAKVADVWPLSGLIYNFSVAAWIKVDPGAPSSARSILSSSGVEGWSVGVTSNELRFRVKGISTYTLNHNYPLSTWFHVAFVFDEFHDVKFFVDGVEVGQVNGWFSANYPDAPWLIGASTESSEFWHGSLDDLQVYSGTLSAADVLHLYQNPGSTVISDLGTSECFGDGTGTACPCGNIGQPGEGCANSTGFGAKLEAMGSPSLAIDNLQFVGSQMPAGSISVLFVGQQSLNNGNGILFGDGLRCAGGPVQRLGVRGVDPFGYSNWGPALAGVGMWSPGDTRSFQVWYQDSGGSPCGGSGNTSHAIVQTFGH